VLIKGCRPSTRIPQLTDRLDTEKGG